MQQVWGDVKAKEMGFRSLPPGLPAFLSRVLPSAQLHFAFPTIYTRALKPLRLHESPGSLVKIMGSDSVGLVWGQRFCISEQLLADASIAALSRKGLQSSVAHLDVSTSRDVHE